MKKTTERTKKLTFRPETVRTLDLTLSDAQLGGVAGGLASVNKSYISNNVDETPKC
jgi:hypothetical protein